MCNFDSTILTLFILMTLSCKISSSNSLVLKKTDSLVTPTDSSTMYLPYPQQTSSQSKTNQLVDKKYFDTSVVQGWSFFLFRFNEPILCNYGGTKDIYRFTWCRTFDSPLCLRIENNNGEIRLISKELTGKSGYSIGRIAVDTTVYLTKEKWDVFISLLDSAKFWEISNNSYEMGFDGATWLLEGFQNQKYHWASRWSPGKTSHFGMACQYLVSVSPIKVDQQKIY
jgi:hypothetical protein